MVAASSRGALLLDARDPALKIVYVNAAFEQISDYTAGQLEGTSWSSIVAADEDNSEIAQIRAAIGRTESCQAAVTYYRIDGSTWTTEISVQPIYGVRGDARYFFCQHQLRDVEREGASVEVDLLRRALGQARQKIVSLNRTDPVTGLMRYDHFLLLLKRDLAVARREERPLCVLVFGIVELDTYRQTFGGNAADSAVRMIGAQIAGVFRRAGDICSRCDETTFAVALRGQDASQAAALAQRVAEKVRNLGLHNPRAQMGRHLCIGGAWAAADPCGDDAEGLLERARTELAAAEIPLQQQA
jgi:diguanylate cyclase (GGDEF)-like protein/PAS domain S-box-containing protein